MKAILIDPVKKEVSEVVYTGPYTQIYKLLSDPDNGLNVDNFDIVELDENRNTLYVDGEGLLTNPKHFFQWDTYHQPLAGRGLVLAADEEGETIGTTLTVEDVKKHVSFGKLSVQGFVTDEGHTDHPVLGPNTPFIRSTPVFGPPEED